MVEETQVNESVLLLLNELLSNLFEGNTFIYKQGELHYKNEKIVLLSKGKSSLSFSVEDEFEDYTTKINFSDEITASCTCNYKGWCEHKIAGLFLLQDILEKEDLENKPEGKQYEREGMIKRVIEERKLKSKQEKFRIRFATNCYGEHVVTTEKAKKYKLTLRDFEQEKGYCTCKDYQSNKLGTCKHLMFAFKQAKEIGIENKKQRFPFVEIYLDTLNNNHISWYYPHSLNEEISSLIRNCFGDKNYLEDENISAILSLIQKTEGIKQVVVRPEVLDKVEHIYDERLINNIQANSTVDFKLINADLYAYQKEGIEFAIFKKGAIIADEMGLGKTIQAISTAVYKKQFFGFQKTLIICPASLKSQWKKEIEKFTKEEAVVIEGNPEEREIIYKNDSAYFFIANYESVLRDITVINKSDIDFVILDEAQRIKNYETLTANAIKSIVKKHALVITGTPIENKLIDLFSIVEFVKPGKLAPLWEFSYQHCLFDEEHKNKITGYYNLQELKSNLRDTIIRREKKDVINQINKITHIDIPVDMHPIQQDYHASSAQAIASILRKKFKTPYDMQRLSKNLQIMRMACDSSYLVDKETFHSPKLIELEEVLLEKLNLQASQRKVIIFSEWKQMLLLIGKLLNKHNIVYAELNGSIPVKNRKKIIQEFEENPDCKVFLSTEAGGSGLNLQFADTVINFELPWNPAKKNQRIGRIDRIGQKNSNLTVINFITRNSIEMKIASGLLIKQNLFDSVLNDSNNEDVVDFSEKGRAQFLQQLEDVMEGFTNGIQQDIENVELSSDEEDLNEVSTVSNTEAKIQEEEQQKEKEHQAERVAKLKEMEQVMNQGMGFLSSLFKMSTGKDLASSGSKVEIDEETGEVVMRFKLPN